MAGESAGRSARRMREKAERLNRAAEHWERGADGERRTATVLDALPRDQWTVLHDVRWPGRPRANLDHVVVGPSGVFVIDSKNWSGRVTVIDGVLRQNGRRREQATAGAREAAAAVRGLAPDLPTLPVHAVLCFVAEEDIAGRIDDVILCSTSNLTTMLQSRRAVLDPVARAAVASRLAAGLSSAPTVPGKLTLSDRITLHRIAAERSSHPRASRSRRRTQRPVAALVGASLAVGVVGVSLSQPQILDRIGSSLVGFMTEDLGSEPPVEGTEGQEPEEAGQGTTERIALVWLRSCRAHAKRWISPRRDRSGRGP